MSELADFNLEVTAESLYLVMSAYANAGDVKGVDEIMSRYLSMNFQPTTKIGNTVLKSLASAPGKAGFDNYYKTYQSLFGPKKLKPDTGTFTVLLKACLDGGHIAVGKKEFEVLKESKLKVTPELHDLHRQLTGYEGIVNYSFNHKILWGVAAKDLSPMERFRRSPGYEDALARMRAQGNYHDSMRYSAEIGDFNSVRAMIAEMESKNYSIDIDMMNTLISAYANNGDLAGGEGVIKDMKKYRLRPNFSTMRILIRSCSNHGNPAGAEKILERAMSMGMRIGDALYPASPL